MIVPTLPRGNASTDAPRSALEGDAERPGLHSHAERGNDQWGTALVMIVPTLPRGNASTDAPRSALEGRGASRAAFPRRAWERSGRHGFGHDRSHAPAWECLNGRSAFGSGGGRGASRAAFPRRAWERSGGHGFGHDRSHAPAWERSLGEGGFIVVGVAVLPRCRRCCPSACWSRLVSPGQPGSAVAC